MLLFYNFIFLLLCLLTSSVKCCKPDQFQHIRITEKLTRATPKTSKWKETALFEIDSNTPSPLVIANKELSTCRENIKEYEERARNARKIEIHLHKIPVLQSGALQNMDNLHTVSLEDNNIETIEPEAFQNLAYFFYLNLDDNYIKEISAAAFSNLNQLETISLSNNNIDHIASGAFDGLRNLTRINLSNNKLANWDERWFANTPNLFFVEASHNQLSSIPKKSFDRCKSALVKVDLSYNKIAQVDGSLFENALRLNYLDLSHNKLECMKEDLLNVFRKPVPVWLNIVHNEGVGCACMINVQKWFFENGIRLHKDGAVHFEKYLQVKCNEKFLEMLESVQERISALESKS